MATRYDCAAQLTLTSPIDCIQVFDELHAREEDVRIPIPGTDESGAQLSEPVTELHCHNVWFASQLPWRADLAAEANNCLFSVIQSTTGVSPSSVLRAFKDACDT